MAGKAESGMVTQEELDSLMAELCSALRELGIPLSGHIEPRVQVNARAKRRLGCCILKNGIYTVEVSASLLDQPELLRQTLAHELLHTCWGCRNHGTRWKAYAARAGGALGCSIERTVKLEGEPQERLRREEVKYVLECQACGAKIERFRMSKAVKSPWRYRCRCGGALKRVQ